MQVTQPAPLPGECSPATEYAQVPVQGKDGKYLRPSTVNLILLQCTCVCVRFWCQPTFALASLPTSHRGALTPVQRLNYRSCIHLFSWFRSITWFHMKGCITKYIEGPYQWNVTIGSDNRHVQKPTSTSKFLSNSTFENDRRGKRRSSGQQQVHWGSHCKAILNHGRVGDLKML